MTGPFTDTGVITGLTRLKYSRNGNPRYEVALDNGNHYITQTDSACAYEIDNVDYRGVTVELSLTKAYRIWGIQVA
jgi:hypothetical protein